MRYPVTRYDSSSPPSILVIGLGPTGVEVALAIAESGRCRLSLGDDATASAEWRKSAWCLLQRRPTAVSTESAAAAVAAAAAAAFGVGKAMKRSQFLSAMLAPLGTQSIAPISPIGDASIVEGFDVVIMTDPTLPHAIAFNEHARAVGCGFILTEARGAVGRIFEDLPRGEGGGGCFSRSFREALIDPRISMPNHQSHDDRNHRGEQTMVPTVPMMHNAHHKIGAGRPMQPRYNSANARESVLSGLVSSSKYMLQQATHGGGGAAARATPAQYAQLHVCFQALHVYWQEHGHLPVVLDRDQAEEIVRIADELVEAGKHVPKEFPSQPQSVDAALCQRVAKTSRVSVPAVSFQLAGLAAAAVLHYLRAHYSAHTAQGGRARANKEEHRSRERAIKQWMFVDELASGMNDSDPGVGARPLSERRERGIAVDTPALEAWLGPSVCEKVAGARVAVIGCGRLGRDAVRCLLLTGACTEPQGRIVLIDNGDAALKNPGSSRQNGRFHTDVSPVPGRASVLRDLVAGCTGPGGVRISAFDGSAQDTDTETDLWEGVDAVVLCAGRGGSPRGAGGVAQESCEALVRFVSHKCVLHGKPLVWGWAGAAGEGGAGVEVMAPGRTSCLVCSSHGGVKELIERRSVASTDGSVTPASFSATENGHRDGNFDETWDPDGRSFGGARGAVAGVMIAELVKVLKPPCRREELRNWRLEIDRSGDCSNEGGSSRRANSGGTEGRGEGVTSRDAQQTWKGYIRPVATTPDLPRMVLSTSFDQLSGDSLRAVPEGFTEWGVEEIRPSLFNRTYVPRRGKADIRDPFSLRALLIIVLARFGVDAKAVTTATPGSECRVEAGGCRERGGGGGGSILLWAEWEKVDGTCARQDIEQGRSMISKMDQSVLSLWQKAVSPASHVEEGRQASRGSKEPRFVYLDVRGVMRGENAVLPVLKYWVR